MQAQATGGRWAACALEEVRRLGHNGDDVHAGAVPVGHFSGRLVKLSKSSGRPPRYPPRSDDLRPGAIAALGRRRHAARARRGAARLGDARDVVIGRALLSTKAIDGARLEALLDRGDAPTMRHVTPVPALVQHLPPGLCERLLALPVRRDPRTGTVDVAVVDSRDPHPVEEMAHWLKAPVRLVRTSLAAMDAALRRMHSRPTEPGPRSLAAPIWVAPSATRPVPCPADARLRLAGGFDRSRHPQAVRRGRRPDVIALGSQPKRPDRRSPDVAGSHAGRDGVRPGPSRSRGQTCRAVRRCSRPGRSPDGPDAVDGPKVRPPPSASSVSREPADSEARRAGRLPRRTADPDPRPSPAEVDGDGGHRTRPRCPSPTSRPALEGIRAAPDRDAILEGVVAAQAAHVAREGRGATARCAGESLVGWTCSPEMAEPRDVADGAHLPDGRAERGAQARPSAVRGRRRSRGSRRTSRTAALARPRKKTPPAGGWGVVRHGRRWRARAIALVIADEWVTRSLSTKHMGRGRARGAGDALARVLEERTQ